MSENKLQEGKNYRWSPEDKIEITGIEFDIIQKSLAIFEGALVFQAASKVRADILGRMIESGIAKEFDNTPTPTESLEKEPSEAVVNPS